MLEQMCCKARFFHRIHTDFFFFSAAQTWRKILYVNILRESLGAEDTVGWGDAAKQTCLAGGKTRLPLIPFGVSKDQSEWRSETWGLGGQPASVWEWIAMTLPDLLQFKTLLMTFIKSLNITNGSFTVGCSKVDHQFRHMKTKPLHRGCLQWQLLSLCGLASGANGGLNDGCLCEVREEEG